MAVRFRGIVKQAYYHVASNTALFDCVTQADWAAHRRKTHVRAVSPGRGLSHLKIGSAWTLRASQAALWEWLSPARARSVVLPIATLRELLAHGF